MLVAEIFIIILVESLFALLLKLWINFLDYDEYFYFEISLNIFIYSYKGKWKNWNRRFFNKKEIIILEDREGNSWKCSSKKVFNYFFKGYLYCIILLYYRLFYWKAIENRAQLIDSRVNSISNLSLMNFW